MLIFAGGTLTVAEVILYRTDCFILDLILPPISQQTPKICRAQEQIICWQHVHDIIPLKRGKNKTLPLKPSTAHLIQICAFGTEAKSLNLSIQK